MQPLDARPQKSDHNTLKMGMTELFVVIESSVVGNSEIAVMIIVKMRFNTGFHHVKIRRFIFVMFSDDKKMGYLQINVSPPFLGHYAKVG